MRRIRIAGLCLVAVFVMGAVFAGAASAANPEYGRCIKEGAKEVTKYDSSKCTKLASEDPGTEAEKIKKGSYVWHAGPGPKPGFTAALKPTTIATLETKAGTKVTCKGLSSTGSYTGLKTVTITKTDFTSCESGGIKCNSSGAPEGTIKVKELEGELGVDTKGSPSTKDKIGNVLWPKGGTATSGAEFVAFACGGLTVKVKNSVISPVTSNAMKLSATVKFTASKGVQKPTKFEGGPNMFLESKFTEIAPYEQSGQSATTIQTNEEKMEIRSL
jgi:hypothetical protein